MPFVRTLSAVIVCVSSMNVAAQDCTPFWTDLGPSLCGALLEVDDGSGAALLVGTDRGVYRYRDAMFEPMPAIPGRVFRLRELAVGGQQSVYAMTLNGTYRWSGSAWDRLPGIGISGDAVVFDDGTGPALFVSSTNRVHKVTDTNTIIGEMSAGQCFPSSLAVWDDGSGSKLYLGGFFTSINGVSARGVAAWDGATWTEVGQGFTGTDPYDFCGAGVTTLLVHDDGRGPALFATGMFQESAGSPVHSVARLNGQNWEAVGGGLGDGYGSRLAVVEYEGATGLWALGYYATIGGIAAPGIARWDGSQWDAPFGGIQLSELNSVNALANFSDADGDALFVGGDAMLRVDTLEGPIGVARLGCRCADLDGDGTVGLADLALLLANFGATGASADGNVDHDPYVDLGDLSILLSQFGTACG